MVLCHVWSKHSLSVQLEASLHDSAFDTCGISVSMLTTGRLLSDFVNGLLGIPTWTHIPQSIQYLRFKKKNKKLSYKENCQRSMTSHCYAVTFLLTEYSTAPCKTTFLTRHFFTGPKRQGMCPTVQQLWHSLAVEQILSDLIRIPKQILSDFIRIPKQTV